MAFNINKKLISKGYILGVLVIVVVLAFINCIVRSSFQFSIDYNEGWNAFYVQKVLNNEHLYSSNSPYIGINYPPLSYYFIAFISKISGNILMTGRFISLISTFLISYLVALIVKKSGGAYFESVFSGVFCLGLLSILANQYVGMNDPQLLGNLFDVLALMIYIFYNKKYLFLVALLLIISIFIKHSLVILPIALFVDLLLKNYKRAFKYILFMFISTFLFISLIFLISEQQFFIQIISLETSRIFSIFQAFKKSLHELAWIQMPIVVGIIYLFSFQKEDTNRTILIYILFSIVIGVYFSGGEGVDINVFFDLFISLSIAIGFVLKFSQVNIDKNIFPYAVSWILPFLIALGVLLISQPKLFKPSLLKVYEEKEKAFLNDVEMLKKNNGSLMCENILLCYFSGKSLVYDSFHVSGSLKSGELKENELIHKIEQGEYTIIQLKNKIYFSCKSDFSYGNLNFPASHSKRYSENTLKAIKKYYSLFHTSRNGFFYRYKTNSNRGLKY